MRVVKPSRRCPRGSVVIIGEDGINEFGEPFNYNDYFLPEELGLPGIPNPAQTSR
jgi:hypothetical protein